MRLIDADKLKKVIHCAYSDDLEILEKIDLQPTAYDIDKVVEELENEIGCNDHCSYKGAYCDRGNCRWSITDDVIDIVEAGMKNED